MYRNKYKLSLLLVLIILNFCTIFFILHSVL